MAMSLGSDWARAPTVSVKDCVAFGSVPFAAATVKGKLPDADGVPESTHEAESVTRRPAGEPDVEHVGAGEPVVTIWKLPA